MAEIVEGLGTAERERIGALRRSQSFFWIDLSVGEASRDDLRAVLGVMEPALQPLLASGRASRPRESSMPTSDRSPSP